MKTRGINKKDRFAVFMRGPLPSIFIILALQLVIGSGNAEAWWMHGTDEDKVVMTVPSGETVNGDYFAYGDSVEISGVVEGDVYAIGGEVLVDGEVMGDLLAAGGTVKLTGKVAQDARIAGGHITVDGAIGRNLSVAGGNIDITGSSSVGGGVAAAGGSVTVAGPVGGDLMAAAGRLLISGSITGGVDAAVGEMRLTSKASVGGDVRYLSDEPAQVDERAKVGGTLTHEPGSVDIKPSPYHVIGFFAGFGLFMKLVGAVSTLILGTLLIRLAPVFVRTAQTRLTERPWVSLGLGFVILVMVPATSILLMVTVFAAPVALVLMALFFVVLYTSKIFVISWAGDRLARSFNWTTGGLGAFALGLALYFILTIVPFAGSLLAFITMLFGLGALFYGGKEFFTGAKNNGLL